MQGVGAALGALRPRQWLKNVLVVAAPLAAGVLLQREIAVATGLAFVALCVAASGTYLVNDLVDLEADRAHPVKRNRPIAAGSVPVPAAVAGAALLLLTGIAIGFAVRAPLGWTVVAYVAVSLSYSLRLKREPVLELGLLALGFLLRAVAGGTASGVPLSGWFLIVAGFGSLFMAAGKRYSELRRVESGRGLGSDTDEPLVVVRVSLSGYSETYLRFVWQLAAAVTVTAYCLWAFEVAGRSSSLPWVVWSVVPLVLGLLRYAVDIDRGDAEAPEDAVLHDRILLATGLAWLVLFGMGALGV